MSSSLLSIFTSVRGVVPQESVTLDGSGVETLRPSWPVTRVKCLLLLTLSLLVGRLGAKSPQRIKGGRPSSTPRWESGGVWTKVSGSSVTAVSPWGKIFGPNSTPRHGFRARGLPEDGDLYPGFRRDPPIRSDKSSEGRRARASPVEST